MIINEQNKVINTVECEDCAASLGKNDEFIYATVIFLIFSSVIKYQNHLFKAVMFNKFYYIINLHNYLLINRWL